jgi:hypothetical protein
MTKFSALIAVVAAFLVVPALASAAPTASQITAPSTTAYVTFDKGNPGTFHVAGTTLGGIGNVDLRCYSGAGAPLVASNVPVAGGNFSTDVPVTEALLTTLGYPHPFCMLRAVPTGTTPSAPVDKPSEWQGVFVGWGWRQASTVGSGFSPTPPTAQYDYYVGRAQSKAMNDFDSIASCGLCDTHLFVPGSQAPSNPIWYANAQLEANVEGVNDRTAVRIDGVDAYTGHSAYWNGVGHHMANNPGFPAVTFKDMVDQNTGNLSIEETAAFATCAESPSVFPPTPQSCATFNDSGVHYERSIETRDSGHIVTIVDHWKSVDGKSHDLDAIYDDTEESSNWATPGHQGIANFTWTQDGFKDYPANTQIPVPASAPATMLVKTDASTPSNGDNMNPIGAMVFGSKPESLKLLGMANLSYSEGEWQSHYRRTIPAGGEITIAVAYAHDFSLASVQAKAQNATTLVTPPAINVATPQTGATVDAASVHVSGSASSADTEVSVTVNGTPAMVDAAGNWSADVPLGEGANQIIATAFNDIGVATNAIVTVTHQAASASAPAAASAPAPAATAPVVAKPVRCVVPKLRGKTLPKAKRLLKRAHCRLGKVTRVESKRVKAGRVIKTRLKAGTRHRAGTRIRVTVAKKA